MSLGASHGVRAFDTLVASPCSWLREVGHQGFVSCWDLGIVGILGSNVLVAAWLVAAWVESWGDGVIVLVLLVGPSGHGLLGLESGVGFVSMGCWGRVYGEICLL